MTSQIPGHGEEMVDKSIEFGRMLANPKPGEEVVITGKKSVIFSITYNYYINKFRTVWTISKLKGRLRIPGQLDQ